MKPKPKTSIGNGTGYSACRPHHTWWLTQATRISQHRLTLMPPTKRGRSHARRAYGRYAACRDPRVSRTRGARVDSQQSLSSSAAPTDGSWAPRSAHIERSGCGYAQPTRPGPADRTGRGVSPGASGEHTSRRRPGRGATPHRDRSPAGHDPLVLDENSRADSAVVAGTLDRRASQSTAVEVRVDCA